MSGAARGTYNPSRTEPLPAGETTDLRLDSRGNLRDAEQFQALAEDNAVGVVVVENRYVFFNIAAAGTQVLKSGPGLLHRIVINTFTASQVITIYDSLSGAGTKIGTITFPASLLNNGPVSVEFNCTFATGLTFVTATGTPDITVVYR